MACYQPADPKLQEEVNKLREQVNEFKKQQQVSERGNVFNDLLLKLNTIHHIMFLWHTNVFSKSLTSMYTLLTMNAIG